MDTGKTFLFVTWEGGGNVPPVLGLAKRLIARGHTVLLLAEPCQKDAIEAMGAEFIAFKHYFTRTNRAVDLIQDWNAGPLNLSTLENTIVRPTETVTQETIELLKERSVDVLVADLMMIGAMIAAEASGIKYAVLFHMPEYLPGPNRPPGGFGLSPLNGQLGKVRDWLLGRLFRAVTSRYLKQLNKIRKDHELPPLSSFMEFYDQANLRLIQTSESFDWPILPPPPNVRYVGPILDDPSWSEVEPLTFDHTKSRPLILVSLSSTYQNQRKVLENIIAGLSSMEVNAVITLGPSMAHEKLSAPKHIQIIPSYPHNQLMPQVHAVITHAGHGTVMRALVYGLPLICLPMGRDQIDNAARVVEQGAGLKLNQTSKPLTIRKAVDKVLKEGTFSKKAKAIGQQIIKDAEANLAVKALEDLIEPGK